MIIAPVIREYRFGNLRMTCKEFVWYKENNQLAAQPVIVCQTDRELINTLLDALTLAERGKQYEQPQSEVVPAVPFQKQ
mgnify:CR=1 FL=1